MKKKKRFTNYDDTQYGKLNKQYDIIPNDELKRVSNEIMRKHRKAFENLAK